MVFFNVTWLRGSEDYPLKIGVCSMEVSQLQVSLYFDWVQVILMQISLLIFWVSLKWKCVSMQTSFTALFYGYLMLYVYDLGGILGGILVNFDVNIFHGFCNWDNIGTMVHPDEDQPIWHEGGLIMQVVLIDRFITMTNCSLGYFRLVF